MTNTNPLNRLALERYPRSARYDPAWILENQMGPNPLWLVEALTEVMPVPTGWRVLDLGAGTALTSIFLAKEFGVSVVAVDLWIDPSENQRRIHAAGVDQDVYRFEPRPTTYRSLTRASTRSSASTHTTTSAPVSSTFLASPTSSGQEGGSGSSSRGSWPNLERSGRLHVDHADLLRDGWKEWLLWLDVCQEMGVETDPNEVRMVRDDAGRNLGFTRIVASRRS